MERKQIESSNIISIGYDENKNEMEVEFKEGGIYIYNGVSKESHENLINSPSIGSHFYKHIKGKHNFSKKISGFLQRRHIEFQGILKAVLKDKG